jgi:hypothetical protein
MRYAVALILLLAAPAGAQDSLSLTADVDRVAGQYKPDVKVDEFTKAKTISLDLGSAHAKCRSGSLVSGVKQFKLTKIQPFAGLFVYTVSAVFLGGHWIFQGDTPMQFLADTTLVELEPFGHPRRDAIGGDMVAEYADYRARPEQLRALASATRGKVRIVGERGECTWDLSKENLARIRQFVAHEMPAQ